MSITRSVAMAFMAGDESATEKVYLEYKNLMFFVIASYVSSKSDIDDILSESFLKAIEKREQIKEPHHLKAFLVATARNQAIDFLRKNRLVPSSDVLDEIYGDDDRSNDFLSLIEPLLSNKETIVVYYKIGFSYTWPEISKETGIPVSSVRRIYDKAKEKLRKGLAA
ncbi:MAG: RNA polymerase sigma factor [Bacilli bacterium]|nr:RNA polymerase sigma factor [Bacilli bacterium]